MIPLFEQYPRLSEKLPYIRLGEFPTPLHKLARMGREIGVGNLYIKRDDLSGGIYGGNKVRKLEFIFGNALRKNAKTVMTFGVAGSNHVLATAIYAKETGLKCISMLLPQHNARYVRRNLLKSQLCGAELHYYKNTFALKAAAVCRFLLDGIMTGRFPMIIPPGGSSPLGITGYVNAAFELKRQIAEGTSPEPDYIYVALGTMGTAVGLMLGLRAAGLKSRVIPVRVVDEGFANVGLMRKMFRDANELLHSSDGSFPLVELSKHEVSIRHDFIGRGYAVFTKEGMKAVGRLRDTEGISLEGTYTGKAFGALIRDADEQKLKDKTALFWNTYNSRDFSGDIINSDYHMLPRRLHGYFEDDVQPLDGNSSRLAD